MNFSKNIFLFITTLIITPFIIFLGKNYLQTEFITYKYFLGTFFYCLFFICTVVVVRIIFKKSLVFILFLAYLSFLQFYFFEIEKFFLIFFSYAFTKYYVLVFIILLSLIAAFISRSPIFRNFFLILLLLNITISVSKLVATLGNSLQIVFKNADIIDNPSTSSSLTLAKYPNIFYIIPDGLASPKILKDYSSIDFKNSIKNFEEKGFSVPRHNYSSYNKTHLSLAALFEMDYPVTEKSLIYKNRNNFYPTIRDKKPEILQYLKKNNYKFIIVPPLWGGCPTSKDYRCLIPTGNSFLSSFFQDYAISTMFQKSLIKKFLYRYNIFNISSDMNDSGKTALNQMKKNPKHWKDGGVFTMIHMLMPHVPYREENCSITNRYAAPSREGYRSSVYCTFDRIHELSDFIIKNYPDANIVVQGDHGIYPDFYPKNKRFVEHSESLIDHRLGAFSAVRGCNSEQAAKLNQAHIVEYIVECLIDDSPTKEFVNKSFFGFYEESPDYGKIFRIR